MSREIEIDVLVVGLGPAGASAAEMASRNGACVLAVERNAKAGLPVQCAEFVPLMIGSDLPSVRDARVQNIDRMLTYVCGENADVTPDFHGTMISRQHLDAELVNLAIAAGTTCRFRTPVRAVDASGTVRLGDGTIVRTKVIIGADGPRSVVGKAIGCSNDKLVETRQISVDLLVPHGGTDIFLSPDIIGGYGWLFPKGNQCNIGLGVATSQRHLLKPLLSQLHAHLVDEGRVGKNIHAHTGGSIPVGGMVGPIGKVGRANVLLCGDAAGLTNPVTGAGINSAVISGKLAGEAAVEIIAGNVDAASEYADDMEAMFSRSLSLAKRRRQRILAAYRDGMEPSAQQLRESWIAYPQYWTDGEDTAASIAGKGVRISA